MDRGACRVEKRWTWLSPWACKYLHWCCVYQGFDSFFNRMICFCFYCWILRVLCMFWRPALYQTCLLQIFWMFSFSWESYFKVCVIFWNPKYIIASKSQLNLLALLLLLPISPLTHVYFSRISNNSVPSIILLLPEKHSLIFFKCECSGDKISQHAYLKMSLFDNNGKMFSGISF